jgi:hypothetical protein
MPDYTVSGDVDSMLRSANDAAIRSAIGVGTTDAPTFLSVTISGDGRKFYLENGDLATGRFGSTYWKTGELVPMLLRASGALGWSSANSQPLLSGDTFLYRDGADGILAQRNGTNAQAFRVYNSTDATPATNFDRAVFGFVSNVLRIGVENGGTYTTARAIEFFTGGFASVNISSGGSLSVGRSTSPGSISVLNTAGASNIQLSGNISYGYHMAAPVMITWGNATQLNGSLDTGLERIAGGTVGVNTGTAGTFGFLKAKLQTSTAYTGTVVAATGYITIYDSTGTAYRVPCAV